MAETLAEIAPQRSEFFCTSWSRVAVSSLFGYTFTVDGYYATR